MPKALGYSVEFVLALRERWAKRDTAKRICEEYGWTRYQFLHLLKGDLPLFRKSTEMQSISSKCGNGKEMFPVEQSGDARSL